MAKKTEIAILYLSKNFRKKVNLDEIASISGISPFHFHRIFVKENNYTPFAYLETIRMQHATHIMTLFPNWSITDVAFECGYSSPGIFSRAFSKYYGVAPSKYKPKSLEAPKSKDIKEIEPIQIQYLPKKTIVVQKVPLIEEKLNNSYQRLINSSTSIKTVFGFYLDAPFHIPPKQCRYFIGIESEQTYKDTATLTIAAGYYTSIMVSGGFQLLKAKMIALNKQLNAKGYVIDSLIGHEKISVTKGTSQFNYMQTQRELFARIKRE